MQIVKIMPNENGSHDNHTLHGVIPDGWAVIPDDMVCKNFPFGEVIAKEVDGVMVVTAWTPGVMPEPDPEPAPEEETSVWDELDAAYQEGVDSV